MPELLKLSNPQYKQEILFTMDTTEKKMIRTGDIFETKPYGLVRFDGFDYYRGQKTLKLYSSEFKDTYYPLPRRIEAEGYSFFDD